MKIEVNVRKKYTLVLLSLVIILAGVLAVYAYNSAFSGTVTTATKFGHSADEVVVQLSGGQTSTLQDAITQGKIGGSGGFSHYKVFSSGTTPWPVPSGVSQVMVEVWGAGGQGQTNSLVGGGGGGYGRGIFSVTPGTTYTITAGAGGGGFSGQGGAGGTSSVIDSAGAELIHANGGNSVGNAGGSAGSTSSSIVQGTLFTINGGAGGSSWGGSGGNGGAGGTSGVGGQPTAKGVSPGGGGGGQTGGIGQVVPGAAGADGEVIIWW